MVAGVYARGSGVFPKVCALEGIDELRIADRGTARSIVQRPKEGESKRERERGDWAVRVPGTMGTGMVVDCEVWATIGLLPII